MSRTMANAWIQGSVRKAHPDYVAVLISASGLESGPTSVSSEVALREAETAAVHHLAGREPHDLPEVQVWRSAFHSFGVKPREARSSVEALLRRSAAGLPRIDRLTDIYNAVSVLHRLPLGGEDLSAYSGAARLVVATGDETFDTIADGEPVVQAPAPGEVVWRDDIGVTCRRWNWRQCVRTRLSESTTDALFIIDGLGPGSRQRAQAAADDLVRRFTADSPTAEFSLRTLAD